MKNQTLNQKSPLISVSNLLIQGKIYGVNINTVPFMYVSVYSTTCNSKTEKKYIYY